MQQKQFLHKEGFLSHLDDLRSVLVKAILFIISSSILSFIFIDRLYYLLFLPYNNLLVKTGYSNITLIKAISPTETILVSLKLAFIAGLVISFPIIFLLLWRFIAPGLKLTERKSAKYIVFMGIVFFIVGVLFSYKVVFPLGIEFLWKYSMSIKIYPEWTVSYYMNFAISFLLSFGVAFMLPVVVVLLAKMGVITPAIMRKGRKYAVVIIFILAAILSPPDVLSQILLGVPLLGLYELSILLARIMVK